ncbi:unnamed protein product [Clonostachys rhizophaga]|uniref:Uncharacterized protein n=1 Tax=Clonostachys rhizophaga TaxID=160324 RepID=A0A9N9V1M5_9HYPO|nr:unnamed protein product [Clonostachys rhizophaga]
MTSPPDHLQMVSLRGEEYVFELKGMMPDGLIEVYRQLYMDSFLIFVLPVDVENIKYFRAWSVREALNFCTDLRLHNIPSDLLSMKIDKIVWESMLPTRGSSYASIPMANASKGPSCTTLAYSPSMVEENGTILRRRNPNGQLLDRFHASKCREAFNTGESRGVPGGTTVDAVVHHPRNSAQEAGKAGLASFSSGTLRLKGPGLEPLEGS